MDKVAGDDGWQSNGDGLELDLRGPRRLAAGTHRRMRNLQAQPPRRKHGTAVNYTYQDLQARDHCNANTYTCVRASTWWPLSRSVARRGLKAIQSCGIFINFVSVDIAGPSAR